MDETQSIVFEKCKVLLAKHSPPFSVVKETPGEYHLSSKKPSVVAGRKFDGLPFVALKANKVGVTLHYMPVYFDKSLAEVLPPAFMKALKGQACFHLGKFDEELHRATEEALRIGVEAFERHGYV